ncbi:MAG: hypothetical protein ACK500_00790 [Flavobacteriales bacterium]
MFPVAPPGPLRIGHTISGFQWNGTGQFGGHLASGVFLYRVRARRNGQDHELRQDSNRAPAEKGFR